MRPDQSGPYRMALWNLSEIQRCFENGQCERASEDRPVRIGHSGLTRTIELRVTQFKPIEKRSHSRGSREAKIPNWHYN